MQKLFKTFQRTIYDPAFYRAIIHAPFGDALRFYVKMSLFLSVAMTIVFSFVLVPEGARFVKEEAPALVKQYFPKGLVVSIRKGEVVSNATEPYRISTQGLVASTSSTLNNLLIIDTKSEFSKKTFDEQKTFALLTKHEIITQGSGGRVTIQDLRGVPDITISEETVVAFVDRVRASYGAFVPATIVLLFVVVITGLMLYLLPTALFALVPFFVAWLKKTPMSYAGAYKMSLYAVMPGLVLKSIFNMGGVFFVPLSFTFLIFLLIIAFNMREGKDLAS